MKPTKISICSILLSIERQYKLVDLPRNVPAVESQSCSLLSGFLGFQHHNCHGMP